MSEADLHRLEEENEEGYIDDESDKHEFHRFSPTFERIFALLTEKARWILLFWFCFFLLGLSVGRVFIERAEDRMDAPSGSVAAKDRARFTQVFPTRSSEETMVMYAETKSELLVCPLAECAKRTCVGENPATKRVFESVGRELTNSPFGITYLSAYNVSHTSFDQIKCKFSSENGLSTFGAFIYDPHQMNKKEIHALLKLADHALKRALAAVPDHPEYVRIGFTGVDALGKAGSDASEKQLFNVDLVTMPIALSIFALMVRSPRLLLLCVLNMLLSVVCTFGLASVLVILMKTKPLTVEGTLAQALSVAMSIDYSLFLLRRFRDESKNGRNVHLASKIMLEQAGEVILLSCLTFVSVFVGFLFLPSADLSGLGLVAVVALLVTLSVNLTVTVAMITVFPSFFTLPLAAVSSLNDSNKAPLLLTVTGKQRHRRGAPYKGSRYFACMKRITTRPWNFIFIFVVYMCLLPIAYQSLRLKHNQDAMQISPKGALATKVFQAIEDHFPPGVLAPFSIVVVNDKLDFNSDKEFFGFASQLTTELVRETGVPLELFTSPVSLQGKKITWLESQWLRNSQSPLCRAASDLCSLYQFEWTQSVSPLKGMAMIISAELNDNPFGISGGVFIDHCQTVFKSFKGRGFEMLIVNTEVDFHADVNVAYNSIPYLLAATIVIVFSIIGYGLQSVFVPLRLSLAVFIPLATVFGLSVMVYQDGLLSFLHLQAFEQSEGGFFYFIPIVCLMQALGLVLDYDIFLVHRIVEHRTSGYDLQSSIIKGIWEVNSTINAAGLIMASVFGGLLLSDETAVTHFGFIMCACVLMDTFVVQTFLIPPIISMGDTFAFYPRRVPQEQLITIEDDEFNT